MTYIRMDTEQGDTESGANVFVSIPGIPYTRRLNFLGLQKCPGNPCRRKYLPADMVSHYLCVTMNPHPLYQLNDVPSFLWWSQFH